MHRTSVALLSVFGASAVDACTTIVVGKDASSDGSVFSSHSNDGEGMTDSRLVRIPRANWPEGSMRPVFFSPEDYPRYVGTARSHEPIAAYEPTAEQEEFAPMCEIPQVKHTYQYFEETYGAFNEKQLGISESTCSGIFGTTSIAAGGKACLSIDAMSQIAMERHSRSRDAVAEIGKLAEQYGFYGAGQFEGSAESLLITDKEEAWIFHILPDETGTSAIWAAQRVPDDHFAVVPNVFIIRDIDFEDSTNFQWSESVKTTAVNKGWWDPEDGPLDFTAMYSDGEYAHKYYSGRRAWGVYNLFAPSLGLSPSYTEWRTSKPYPVTSKPDTKIGLEDIERAMRYHYEGTEFDTTRSTKPTEQFAGGVWGSPDHVAGANSTAMPSGSNEYGIAGNWERTIGLYRTSDSYITQSRSWLPDSYGGVLWWGPHAAPYTVYVPLAGGMKSLPDATLGQFMSLDKSTLFWAVRYMAQHVQLKWSSMIEVVTDTQKRWREHNLKLQAEVDAAMGADGRRRQLLFSSVPAHDPLDMYAHNVDHVVKDLWDVCDHMIFKFADGMIHFTETPLGTSSKTRTYDASGITTSNYEDAVIDQPGYPGEWLEFVGYQDGPPPPPEMGGHDNAQPLRLTSRANVDRTKCRGDVRASTAC